MDSSKDLVKLINQTLDQVNTVMVDLIDKNPKVDRILRDSEEIDLAYAKAVVVWEAAGRSVQTFFTTDHSVFLFFFSELSKQFGLEILNSAEAESRNQLLSRNFVFSSAPVFQC